jgi:hypothetical protein
MLLRNKFTLISLFLTLTLSAQVPLPKIKWGTEFKAASRSSLNDIVGYDNTGIYAIKERYGFASVKYSLEHYNQQFIPTTSFDLNLDDNREVELIVQLRNKLFLFSSLADSKTKVNTLSVQEINKKTLRPDPSMITIATINFKGELKSNSGKFRFRVSRDSSKVLVFYNLPYNKDEPESFGFTVLDDQLRPVWSKEATLPFENELFDLESFRVDNQGDVYLLGLIYKEKRKSKRKGAPNYQYQIFAYRDQGKSVKEYLISMEDKFLTDMQIEILNDKNLICAGFYSAKGTYSIRGTFFLTIDAVSKEVKTRSFKEFGVDFLAANMTENQAEKIKKKEKAGAENELYEYDLDRLIVGKDGSAILLGEQYFVNSVTHTYMVNGVMQQNTVVHYYYNDIIAVKINPSGEIQWAEKIAKRQHTKGDGGFFSSYTMALIKGNLCFIFNDNPKNAGYTGTGRVFNYNGFAESMVMVVNVDQSGKQTRQPLFGTIDVDVITRPKVCEQVANNEVILFGQRRKTHQFARLSF